MKNDHHTFHITQALMDRRVSYESRTLYAFLLARQMEFPSCRKIGYETQTCTRVIARRLHELESAGWIVRRSVVHESKCRKQIDYIYAGRP